MKIRPIKFRVWDFDGLNGKWFWPTENFGHALDYAVQFNKPVMQFTGLHDKNGKEIYEGDVVKFKANYTLKPTGWLNGVMVYYEHMFVLSVGIEQYEINEETEGFGYSSEVIGNIYENPELYEDND